MNDTSHAAEATTSSAIAAYLDRVCAALAARSDRRGLVRLVERWSRAGDATRSAWLLQARALVDLCLMDRAWVRLNELLTRDPDDAEAILLAAEMFIGRGWPVRARKLLGRAPESLANNARYQELWRQSEEPPLQPDPNAREIERTGSPQELLDLAVRFQATGSFLRAKSILERLKRQPGPWSARVDDLLWALSGESAREEGDPIALARSLAPEIETDWDRGESTESVRLSDLATGDEGDDDRAFPALFRRLEEPTETAEHSNEVTSVSVLADARALREHIRSPDDDDDDSDEREHLQPLNNEARTGDTQIMLVVRKDGRSNAADTAHRVKDDAGYNLRETLNLREYQRSVGMDPAAAEASEEVALEEEDNELIVVTRREKDPSEDITEPPDDAKAPVEVVEMPIPVRRPAPAQPPAVPAAPPAQPEPFYDESAVESEESPTISTRSQLAPLIVMAVLLVIAGLGLVLLLSVVLGGRA